MHSTARAGFDAAPPAPSFTRSASVYDLVYAANGKDYAAEADRLRAIVDRRCDSGPRSLLDVACGTGEHLLHLVAGGEQLEVVGVDRCPAMLEVARGKLPGVELIEGDMSTLELGRTFDAVTCLFSSVGYLPDVASLRTAVAAMARHTAPGGVLVVEPALLPDRVAPAQVIVTSAEQGDLRVSRRATVRRDGDMLEIEFRFDLRRGAALERFREVHRIRLFANQDYVDAFTAAGMGVDFDEHGCSGLGLYVGRRAS